jgi:hypothetical protein
MGRIQATVSPETKRASVRLSRLRASPQAATVTADSAQASATVRYLPKRSAIGPVMNCIEPCVSA